MPGQKLPINVDTDLTPIANVAGVYNMLVVGKRMQYRTVPEIIDFAKKNPGKLHLRVGRQRHVAASGWRTLQEDGRRQHPARALIVVARPPSRT